MKHIVFALCVVLMLFGSATAYAKVEPRFGGGFTFGQSYDPSSDISWIQGTGFTLFDYETVWRHKAPEPLRFKVEAHAGLTVQGQSRLITSINALALYYLDGVASGAWRPYAEAGIGIIYTDFAVEGQGLRLNFNPQMGIGTDYITNSGRIWFGGLRAHHISNAGLDDENRGINSVTFTLGFYH